MITGLPPAFEAALNSTERKPVQLLHFYSPARTYYLSDRSIGSQYGLDYSYQPWVESFGTLKDNVSINDIFNGDALEIRTSTLTLINSPATIEFIQAILSVGIENTYVELYQWFEGLSQADVVLIDSFVCQDPIQLSEASMLLSIDLVSPVFGNNAYLSTQAPDAPQVGYVVGKATGVPLIDLQTARWTELAEDVPAGATGGYIINNGIGFPASGNVYIDSEELSYSSINASTIFISARAQNGTGDNVHKAGARITIPGASYDYALTAGPVALVDNLLGNGEPYPNPVSLFPGQDPVIARFIGRPPWLKVDLAPGVPIEQPQEATTGFGTGYGSTYTPNIQYPPVSGIVNINNDTGQTSSRISLTWLDYTTDTVQYSTRTSYDRERNISVGEWVPDEIRWLGAGFQFNGLQQNDYINSDVYFDCSSMSSPGGDFNQIRIDVAFDGTQYASYSNSAIIIRLEKNGLLVEEDVRNLAYYTRYSEQIDELAGVTFSYYVDAQTVDELNQYSIHISYNLQNTDRSQNAEPSAYIKFVVRYFRVSDPIVGTAYTRCISLYGIDQSSQGTLVKVEAFISLSSNDTGDATSERTLYEEVDGTEVALGTIPLFGDPFEYGPYEMSCSTWGELQTAQLILEHNFIGGSLAGSSVYTTIQYVRWKITYQPGSIEQPNEERVVYANTMTADVTSLLGEDLTPPYVIKDLLERYADEQVVIDETGFEARHLEYVANSYYLNGVIDGSLRLHGALKQVLQEGMCRFLFNEGQVKLITYETEDDQTIDSAISMDNVAIRSRKILNQPVSQIRNAVTIEYGKILDGSGYEGSTIYTDTASVEAYKLQQDKRQYDLVHDLPTAQFIASRIVAIFAYPISVNYADVFMNQGYVLEKGDRVTIESFVDGTTINCTLISLERAIGQGKNKKINKYILKMADYTPTVSATAGYGFGEYGVQPYGE